MRRTPRLLALLLAALVLAGCGDREAPLPGADPGVDADDLPAPPPIRLVVGDEELELFQGSYCWQSGSAGACVDSVGPTRQDLVDAGAQDSVEVVVDVPLDRISAELVPLDAGRCTAGYDTEPQPLGDGHYRIDPAGPAGRYRVSVWGHAPQGEVPGMFQWDMPAGPVPEPEARLSLVWEPHGELEGQGFVLSVLGLPPGPHEASAEVTARASDGESLTFDAGRPDRTCPRSGDLVFAERGTSLSDRVADLGDPPFAYAVDLVLDGETFHGTGTYPEPEDTDPDNDNPAPVLLTWEPPLPTQVD